MRASDRRPLDARLSRDQFFPTDVPANLANELQAPDHGVRVLASTGYSYLQIAGRF